ncbi:MAG: type II toxin-antitoxin system VapC family toxin [Trueperaceae bacterium]|nr:MAG: type II toxin-antitoxin system VapC family toxin [Trueperaceae bacterium]
MILDTNALSDLLSELPEIERYIVSAHGLYIPSIVLGEYRYGVRNSRFRMQIEEKVTDLLQDVAVLAVESSTSNFYADVRSELKRAGTPIPENDVWIAALVRQHQMPLLSRDAHFDAVERIVRLSW